MAVSRFGVTQIMFIQNDGNKNEGDTRDAYLEEGNANEDIQMKVTQM